MPTRPAPTERQKRLGAELRRMRLAAGRTTEYAAGLLGLDRPKVSNMESGVRATSPERVRILASNYECADEAYVEALAAMADTRKRGWWQQFRGTLPQGLLDVAELEWFATRLRSYQTVHVPGMLQTRGVRPRHLRHRTPPAARVRGGTPRRTAPAAAAGARP